MPLRVVFMGTPHFALPTLKALIESPEIDLVGVLTQPDRPSGRGQKLTPPPVKELAQMANLTVKQPERLRKDEAVMAWLAEQQADFFVTAAFGQILPQAVLDMPKIATVNVHASLLPTYRGANPVQWAVINGDTETGVTTMLTVLEVDAGDMLMRATTPIAQDDTAVDVLGRMAEAGGAIIVPSLVGLASGALVPEAQDASQSTHAPKLTKDDARLDWSQSTAVIHNKIRGQQPWPGAEAILEALSGNPEESLVMKVHRSVVMEAPSSLYAASQPGAILGVTPVGVWVQTGDGVLCITELQPPGKPKMKAADWANGVLRRGEPRFFE
jgi:methionyl-tRNA formyltransferase